MRALGFGAASLLLLLLCSEPLSATGATRTCMFTKGRLIGERLTYWNREPFPIGSLCDDGYGSSGVAVAETEPEEEGNIPEATVEEILTTDVKLLGLDKVAALADQRATAAAKAKSKRPMEAARALLEAGALDWQVGEGARSAADGGMPYICRSFKELQSAMDILRDAGSDAEPLRFEAQFRYAQVLGAGFWYCSTPQCELVSNEAIRLAENGLSMARRSGEPQLIARALVTLADVHRIIALRRESRGFMRIDIPEEFDLRECPTCEPVNREKTRDEMIRRKTRALLEEAIRVEWAEGVWTRTLVESLMRLAALHYEARRGQVARSIAELAANGAAALSLPPRDHLIAEVSRLYMQNDPFAFNARYRIVNLARAVPAGSAMRYVLLARIRGVMRRTFAEAIARELDEESSPAVRSTAIDQSEFAKLEPILAVAPTKEDAPPVPATCDETRLKSTTKRLLEAERRALIATLGQSSEVMFRWTMSALPAEGELFADVLRCGIRDQGGLQNIVERILLRRQVWRFRLAHLGQARATEDPETLETVAKLTDLRRRRAEQRLIRVKPSPATDPLRWALCMDERPAGGQGNEFLDLEKEIAELEDKMPGGSTPATIRNIEHLWPDLLASLGADAILVGYLSVGPKDVRRIAAFVVDGNGTVSWHDAGPEADIGQYSAEVSGGLVKNNLRPAAKVLVDPLEKLLQGKRRIFLLAAGAVRSLPWSALIDRNGKHLGSRFSISWLQWAGDAYAVDTNKPRSQAVFVAPEYEPAPEDVPIWPRVVAPSFAHLTNLEPEIASLTKLLKAARVRVATLRGGDATERAVRKISNPTVLHIAAHGFRVDSKGPLAGDDEETERVGWFRGVQTYAPLVQKTDLEPSFARVGVAFAKANRLLPAEQGDDLLTAGEAADLDLRDTRLVVLSGCNTASPSLEDGSGAYDLALGFRMAGATSVVASLWPVDDDASRLLMEELYKGLLDGLPVADALWRAKDILRRSDKFSDPRFWAAFEVFGPNAVVWEKPGGPESSAGASPTSRDMQILVADTFADERNDWQMTGRRGTGKIREGRYEVDVAPGGWQFATITVPIPEEQDFDISCTVTKLRGENTSSFGLVLAFRDENHYAKFSINGNGRVEVTSASQPLSVPHYSPDDPREEVNKGNAPNMLRITRTGGGVRFFVNGTEVLAMPWPSYWESPKLGFLVNQNLTVAFDDLKIGIPGTAGR